MGVRITAMVLRRGGEGTGVVLGPFGDLSPFAYTPPEDGMAAIGGSVGLGLPTFPSGIEARGPAGSAVPTHDPSEPDPAIYASVLAQPIDWISSVHRETFEYVEIAFDTPIVLSEVLDKNGLSTVLQGDDTLTGSDGKAASAHQHDLALAFARGELTTREVLQAQYVAKSGGMELITPEPVRPLAPCEQGWRYRFVDRTAPASTSLRYRFTLEQTDGSELTLFELEPAGEILPQAVLLAASVAPNPFNPRTRVIFELDLPSTVSLEIHDLRGRRVFARPPQPYAAGRHELLWQGTGSGGHELPTGLYLITLVSGVERRVLKASLVR